MEEEEEEEEEERVGEGGGRRGGRERMEIEGVVIKICYLPSAK